MMQWVWVETVVVITYIVSVFNATEWYTYKWVN